MGLYGYSGGVEELIFYSLVRARYGSIAKERLIMHSNSVYAQATSDTPDMRLFAHEEMHERHSFRAMMHVTPA